MVGTKIGGQKAAKKNKERYGNEFYRMIGSKGGQAGHTGGFAANPILAKKAGSKGGKISTRTGVSNGQRKEKEYVWKGGPDADLYFS